MPAKGELPRIVPDLPAAFAGDLQPPCALHARIRQRRVLLLLAALWVLNIFDCGLTLMAWTQGHLSEANPVARYVLGHGPESLVLYKLTLVGASSLMLWRARFHPLAERAIWLLVVAYAVVAVHWRLCYELYLVATNLAPLEYGFG